MGSSRLHLSDVNSLARGYLLLVIILEFLYFCRLTLGPPVILKEVRLLVLFREVEGHFYGVDLIVSYLGNIARLFLLLLEELLILLLFRRKSVGKGVVVLGLNRVEVIALH